MFFSYNCSQPIKLFFPKLKLVENQECGAVFLISILEPHNGEMINFYNYQRLSTKFFQIAFFFSNKGPHC